MVEVPAAGGLLVPPAQALTPPWALAPFGWDDAWADEFAPYAEQGLVPGRVVRVDRGQCDIITADGTVRADTALDFPGVVAALGRPARWVRVLVRVMTLGLGSARVVRRS